MNEINSTDATQGQGLRARVEIRKHELQAEMDKLPPGAPRLDLERAIGTLDGLLTGDLDNIPPVVAAQLSQWLEANKHLAEHPAAAPPAEAIRVVNPFGGAFMGPLEAPEKVN
ncbi:MAG TPA: hypothetical protein VL463_21130 [Kofleriaceae bacterium]|nr:hypothetical protein [Kofleriaceae bacterium]